MAHSVSIGCSGWVYRSWRESFYPPRTPQARWLEHFNNDWEIFAPRNALRLRELL